MVFSRFIWTILAIVVVIVLTAVGFGIFLQKTQFPVTSSILMVLLVVETLYLFYYLTRIRRDLLKLVSALRNEDPSLQFKKEAEDPYFSEIHQGFNEIIRNFRLIRLDKEAEHQFFRATVDHIQFGIIAYNEKEKVELVNEAFLELFQMEHITHLDSISEVSTVLPETLKQLSHQKESLKQIQIAGSLHHLIFLASRFKLQGREITLISVRDISREIDRNELEAWQKLMRVLRHEILNSISPIKLLAINLSGLLQPEGKMISLAQLSEKEIEDMKTGLDTIHRRATGLSNFLDAYSNLYRVPDLQLKPVRVIELLERVILLFREQFSEEKISSGIHCADPELHIEMDERMVEQVLINLVKNSLDAVREKKNRSIHIHAEIREKLPLIRVKDNGNGIPPDQLESIFIPFYSTKEGGTGIGLSFSQHIMRLHHGQLKVNTSPGIGSEFNLVFPVTESF